MNSRSILLSVAILLLASISCIYGYTNSYANFQITFYTDTSCSVGSKTATLTSVPSQSYSSNEDFIECTTYPDGGSWPSTGNTQSVQFRENYSTCGSGGYYCQTLSLYSGTSYCSTAGTILASFNFGSVNIISGTCVGISSGNGNNINGYNSVKVIRTYYYNGYNGYNYDISSSVTIGVAAWAGISIGITIFVVIIIIIIVRRRRVLVSGMAYQTLQPTPVTVVPSYMPPQPYQQQQAYQPYQPQQAYGSNQPRV